MPPRRQPDFPHGRVERGEQLIARDHVRCGQPVEQRRLAGIGVADQRDYRIGHALARLAVQAAGALHLLQVTLQAYDPLVDPPPIQFELRFAGTAEESSRSEEHTSELQSLMRISYAV